MGHVLTCSTDNHTQSFSLIAHRLMVSAGYVLQYSLINADVAGDQNDQIEETIVDQGSRRHPPAIRDGVSFETATVNL